MSDQRPVTLQQANSPITRRQMLVQLGWAGGAIGALTIGGGFLSACARVSDDDDAPSAADEVVQEPGARRGGLIRFSTSSNPAGFDPPRFWNSLAWNGIIATFDRLIYLGAGGSLEPELATEVPIPERDGTRLTLKLREGVMFHHGRVMTADDVKFSLERLLSPRVASEGGSLYTGIPIVGLDDFVNEASAGVDGISIVDDHTLTIDLEQPDSSLLYVLGLPFASIVPRDVIEDVGDETFNFAPVGTGPFRMTEVDPANRVVLDRFDDHWRGDRPYVDRVEWDIGLDPDLAILRVENNELDLMEEDIPAGRLDEIRGNAELQDRLHIADVNNCHYITLSVDHEALADVRVRQAIAMSIDKERAVRILRGMGTPADGGLFSPLSPYYQPGLSPEYDPEGARQLLAEAGYPEGFDIEFWGANYSPFLEYSQSVQQDLEEIGIRMELHSLVREAWHSIIVENPPGLTQNNWELPYPHGSYIMDSAFTRSALEAGCCNFSNWVDDDFEQLVIDARRATTEEQIVDLYKRMDEIVVASETLWVPVYYPKTAYLISDRIGGYSVPPSPDAGIKFFHDYWVEDA